MTGGTIAADPVRSEEAPASSEGPGDLHSGPSGAHFDALPGSTPGPERAQRRTAQSRQRDADDDKVQADAAAVASLHGKTIAGQIRTANRLEEVGLALATVLLTYLTSEDGIERNRAANLLLLGERDSLAGTATALTNLLHKATDMKRRALGLDAKVAAATGGGAGDATARPLGVVREILADIPEEALMQLREATLRVSRTRAPLPAIEADVVDAEVAD